MHMHPPLGLKSRVLETFSWSVCLAPRGFVEEVPDARVILSEEYEEALHCHTPHLPTGSSAGGWGLALRPGSKEPPPGGGSLEDSFRAVESHGKSDRRVGPGLDYARDSPEFSFSSPRRCRPRDPLQRRSPWRQRPVCCDLPGGFTLFPALILASPSAEH